MAKDSPRYQHPSTPAFIAECDKAYTTANLPPDPETQNDDRSEWAKASLIAFADTTGSEFDTALPDLLADLMHFCDRHSMKFDEQLERARSYYQEDTLHDEDAA